MTETLTRAQERTLPARRALAAKFTTPEEKSAHYRELAERSHAHRLTAEDAERVAAAYRLLSEIAHKLPTASEPDDDAAPAEDAA